MKQKVKSVIVIPVGTISSQNKYEHIADTVASIIHYASPDSRIVIQDNSNPMHLGARLQADFPELEVIRAPQNYGVDGGLYKSLSLAFLHIHATYEYQVLIKMDTDALMIHRGLEDAAIAYFEKNPNVGEMGAYVTEGQPTAWPSNRLHHEMSNLGWLSDRRRCALLRYFYQLARSNGYKAGEHVIGGAVIFNPKLIEKLVQGDFLLREDLRRTKLQEAHLWSFLCKAAGMQVASFQMPEYPLAVIERSLPRSPQELMASNAKVIHSVRAWNELNEDKIRALFKAHRETYDSEPVPQLAEV